MALLEKSLFMPSTSPFSAAVMNFLTVEVGLLRKLQLHIRTMIIGSVVLSFMGDLSMDHGRIASVGLQQKMQRPVARAAKRTRRLHRESSNYDIAGSRHWSSLQKNCSTRPGKIRTGSAATSQGPNGQMRSSALWSKIF